MMDVNRQQKWTACKLQRFEASSASRLASFKPYTVGMMLKGQQSCPLQRDRLVVLDFSTLEIFFQWWDDYFEPTGQTSQVPIEGLLQGLWISVREIEH